MNRSLLVLAAALLLGGCTTTKQISKAGLGKTVVAERAEFEDGAGRT